MTSSPTNRRAPPSGFHDYDYTDDHLQTTIKVLDKNQVERIRLFDETVSFTSKNGKSSPIIDLLPPISEVLDESFLSQSSAENLASTQQFSPAEKPSPLHQQQQQQQQPQDQQQKQQKSYPIPKIVIQCEKNAINIEPRVQTPKQPVSQRQRRRRERWSSTPLPNLSAKLEVEPHNPRLLSLKGEYQGRDNLSTLFGVVLPKLPPVSPWRRGGCGDLQENREKTMDELLTDVQLDIMENLKQGTLDNHETNSNDEESTQNIRWMCSPKPAQKDGTPLVKRRKRQTYSSRHLKARDQVTDDFNNIAKAFQASPVRDGFSPMSGNMTSDLRQHISKMSNTSIVNSSHRFGRGDMLSPSMHLFDVMTTKSKQERQFYENSSPVPIAEGVDLSNLLPSNPPHGSTIREEERDASESKRKSHPVTDDEHTRAKDTEKSEILNQTEEFLETRTIKHETDGSGEKLDKNVGNNQYSNADHRSLPFQHIFGGREIEEDHNDLQPDHPQVNHSEDDLDRMSLHMPYDEKNNIVYNFSSDGDHDSSYRRKFTRDNGDNYLEHFTEISYKIYEHGEENEDNYGTRRNVLCANWKLPKNNDIISLNTSDLPILEKLNNVKTPRDYSSSVNTPTEKKTLPQPVKYNNWMRSDIKSKVDSGLHKNKNTTKQRESAIKNPRQEREFDLSSGSETVKNDPQVFRWDDVEELQMPNTKIVKLTAESKAVIPPSKMDIKRFRKLNHARVSENEIYTSDNEKDDSNDDDDDDDIEEKENKFMKRIKTRVLRMRKILPPPSPSKLCFTIWKGTGSHKEILDQIQACKKVKVTSMQYDPTYITRCGKGGHYSMWIFDISPDSDRNYLLKNNLKIENQVVTVRPLDDVYQEEHRMYQMYHAVRMEQRQKRLTIRRIKKKFFKKSLNRHDRQIMYSLYSLF